MNKLRTNRDGIAHLAVVLVILVIAVAGFVGWRVWDKNKSNNQADASLSTSTEKTNQESNTSPQTANVPEYTGTTFTSKDFSFVYPEGWTDQTDANPEMAAFLVTGDGFPNIYVSVTSTDKSFCNNSEPKTTVTVAGIEAQQFTSSTSVKALKTCVTHNGQTYNIVHGYTTSSNTDAYNQVLNSFKFL